MIEILRKMFEANPEKSTIVLNDNCSGCGCELIIEITTTSGGFGMLGGVLFKSSTDQYKARCPSCYEALFKMDHSHKK